MQGAEVFHHTHILPELDIHCKHNLTLLRCHKHKTDIILQGKVFADLFLVMFSRSFPVPHEIPGFFLDNDYFEINS